MKTIKKTILMLGTGVTGLLLTLAGLELIQISPALILYSGIALLVLTFLILIFAGRENKLKIDSEKEVQK